MSKIFSLSNTAVSAQPASHPAVEEREAAEGPASQGVGTYDHLIGRLFDTRSAVAILGAGSTGEVRHVCEGIAMGLSLAGKRSVVVCVRSLLSAGPGSATGETPSAAEPVDAGLSKYWLWPPRAGNRADTFVHRRPGPPEAWLASLRRNFDAVLLDCGTLEGLPGAVAVGAMADAAILVVEAGRTTKDQVIRDQRALQLTGVKLAGCILSQEK